MHVLYSTSLRKWYENSELTTQKMWGIGAVAMVIQPEKGMMSQSASISPLLIVDDTIVWSNGHWTDCYVLVECSAWREQDGYGFDALHVVLEAYASDTWWEQLVHENRDGTGLHGHGRYPRHMRCSGGICMFCAFKTRLTRELRPKV